MQRARKTRESCGWVDGCSVFFPWKWKVPVKHPLYVFYDVLVREGLAPSALGVCRAIAGPRREKYGFLVEISAAFFRFKKDTQCYFWKTLTGGLKLRKIEGPFWSILKDLWQCESYPNYPTWHQKYGNLNHSTCRTKPQYGLKKGNSLKNQANRKISKK